MGQKASPKSARAALLASKALALRIAGTSYSQIGLALGVSKEGARRAVTRELEKLRKANAGDAQTLVELETLRIDELWFAVYQKAIRGDLLATDRAIKLMQRRADLLGLDAPKKQAITDTEGNDSPELKALAGAARGLAALLNAAGTQD